MTAIPEPLLRLRDWSLTRRTPGGDLTLLQDISLELRPGQWLAVLGANGSGKSSLLKYLASDDSTVADMTAIMFQDPDEQIFAASVERELALGRPGPKNGSELSDFGLAGLDLADPRLLSAGQKQRLVLAVSLGLDPRILLCDEPTALQDPQQSCWVLDRLQQWLSATGGALVTATCDRAEASRADWLVILEKGRILRQGAVADLIDSPEAEALLGPPGGSAPAAHYAENSAGRPLVEIRDLDCRFVATGEGFSGVDLVVKAGERVGITGPNGCGKSTLLAACAGARRPDQGGIRLNGRLLYEGKDRDLKHGNVMLAPQFPEYLFTRATVADEIRLDPVLAGGDPGGFLADLGLPADQASNNPHDLSCGQRRRLALGLVLQSGRPVLLLDEPTAALDYAGRQIVLEQMDRIPGDTAVLIASHDTEFLKAAGCRILNLEPGGLVGSEPSAT